MEIRKKYVNNTHQTRIKPVTRKGTVYLRKRPIKRRNRIRIFYVIRLYFDLMFFRRFQQV